MTTLAANSDRTFERKIAYGDRQVVASDILWAGSAGGDNASGYIRPLVAADVFAGFVERKVDNSSGSAGDKTVRLIEEGEVVLSVTGAASVADENEAVYASDDDTFTLTAGGNSSIGKVVRWISGTSCLVFFQAGSRRSI